MCIVGFDMEKKKLLACSVLCGFIIIGCGLAVIFKDKTEKTPVSEVTEKKIKQEPVKEEIKVTPPAPVQKPAPKEIVKKADLFSDNTILPLSAITEIANLPSGIQDDIRKLIENSNLYYLKRKPDGVFMIVGSSGDEKYMRHDIKFVEINPEGVQKITNIGQEVSDEDGDWDFNEDSGLPLKHIKYDEDGDIEYTEIWNYSDEEPVKYEMKNGDGKILSIKKETPDGDTKIRSEHLVYDEDGNTRVNVSASYEGPDITRFTYYNSENPQDGVTLMSEYNDGLKTKETVYSSDYKLQNTYNAGYKDGERVTIKVLDSSNNKVEEIISNK